MLKSGFHDVLDIAVNVGIIVPDNLEIKIPSKDRDKAKDIIIEALKKVQGGEGVVSGAELAEVLDFDSEDNMVVFCIGRSILSGL